MSDRIRVGILFGGESGEHEVSVASARSVFDALDPSTYQPVAIGITRQGAWLTARHPEALLGGEITLHTPDAVQTLPAISHGALVPANGHALDVSTVDVIFPVLHGPRGEDGTVQGMLELAHIPYVGSGVLASAVSLDKAMMKVVFAGHGLRSVPYQVLERWDWQRQRGEILDRLTSTLRFPMFVKPCNMGSSVGISKAHDPASLAQGIDLAARHDTRLIIEQGVVAREIECSVLGNHDPLVSLPGEVIPRHEFYDYDAKYTQGLSDLLIPAPLNPDQMRTVQDLARQAFHAVDAAGLARVDFFLLRDTGEILINEINTMPGFTSTSMYAKLWEATGISYPQIVDRLIQLALERFEERSETRG